MPHSILKSGSDSLDSFDLPKKSMRPLLDTYSREIKTYVHIEICTQTFIAALFIIAERWKPPECPGTSKWMNNGDTSMRQNVIQP